MAEGHLNLLFALAIPCCVHNLRVTSCALDGFSEGFWLATVLTEYKPRELFLQLDTNGIDTGFLSGMHTLDIATPYLLSAVIHTKVSDEFEHIDQLLVRIHCLSKMH